MQWPEDQYFVGKVLHIAGWNYPGVLKKARLFFSLIEKKTKRRPYIRSSYFRKKKIFFDYFWPHLFQKHLKERTERLRFLPCAIELLEKSHVCPLIFQDKHQTKEKYYRFFGKTSSNEFYCVQVKEHLLSGKKYLVSIFAKKR